MFMSVHCLYLWEWSIWNTMYFGSILMTFSLKVHRPALLQTVLH